MDKATDFGQIDIYNTLFADASGSPHTPTGCIYGKLSYCGFWNKARLPIMIGSELHRRHPQQARDNPLKMNGYFIIDGLCKSLSLISIINGTLFTKDRAYLTNGRRITILAMGQYEITYQGKKTRWYLPINYEDIASHSVDAERLLTHLHLVADHTDDNLLTPHADDIDCMILCYLFENWIGISNNVRITRRLITPGEMIHEAITNGYDVVKFFRTHKWVVRNIQNVTSVSEDMKHYSMLGDVESIRRITFPTSRENMRMKDRYVKDEERGLICPVQTSDGSLCGTILYLAEGARVSGQDTFEATWCEPPQRRTSEDFTHDPVQRFPLPSPGFSAESHSKPLFVNGRFQGWVSKVDAREKVEDHRMIQIWTNIGRIYNPTHHVASVTVNYIPFRHHNPAVRAMFASSMIKQALTQDPRLNIGFNDTKRLIKAEQPHVGKPFPYPAGWNLRVAIMPWYGYNVEDAVVISKSTSKKFMSEKIATYASPFKHREDKILEKFVKVDDVVEKGAILYRTFRPAEMTTIETMRSRHEGVVTAIIEHSRCFTVVISKFRVLEVGDKMCSRHGQKGIVSLILEDQEMPHYYDKTTQSWNPIELLINPHAFPSRMTWGQIIEQGNAETEVRLPDGFMLPQTILTGSCYYMALRHQVADKVQFRDTHNIDQLSLQAVSGKAKSGGLRFGHMERDILIALGAHTLLDELYSIDRISINLCPSCGMLSRCDCPTSRVSTHAHQYLLICAGLLRVNGYDLRYWPSKEYALLKFDVGSTPLVHAGGLDFGEHDMLDVRHYFHRKSKTPIGILPVVLRSLYLETLYARMFNETQTKAIVEEHKRLLFGKNGAYHKFCEGHRVNHCLRSVIVPGPELPLDTVEIPFGSDIGRHYGILNRQPSLTHKSMMSVTLKVGTSRCIRFNPQLCEAFNADFDGDEMCVFGTVRRYPELPVHTSLIQDYRLGSLEEVTRMGLTANRAGIELMVSRQSKGKPFNVQHLFERVGNVMIAGKLEGVIEGCYERGLTEEEWVLQAKAAREGAASIGINTPFTGELNAICNRMAI